MKDYDNHELTPWTVPLFSEASAVYLAHTITGHNCLHDARPVDVLGQGACNRNQP